jgi:aspartate aminotransferase
MPDGPLGRRLRMALLGVASEIWSAPSGPVQYAAAVAFEELDEIRDRIAASRRLHASVACAAASVCQRAGLLVPVPQAAFYLYPDFDPWRFHLRADHGVTTSAGLARLLLRRYGAATLPGSAFGDHGNELRLRLATALLYGESPDQQEAALAVPDPLSHPPIGAALGRLAEILSDLTGSEPTAGLEHPKTAITALSAHNRNEKERRYVFR